MPSRLQTALSLSLSLTLLLAPVEALLAHGGISSVEKGREDLSYLDPNDFQPRLIFAEPPAAGSPAERFELARIKTLIAEASPQRLAKAKWDGEHEDPSAFNETLGVDLAKLPATWAMLIDVQNETDAIIERGKDFFARPRPYSVDPSLRTCSKGDPAKAARSYPSGHAGSGYSMGWILAKLLPSRAPSVLLRADDFALSRELCAAHFHSDTEASHVIATLVADRLFNDPRFAPKLEAARHELGSAGLPTR